MSEQDDRETSWQEAAGSSGSHPVLADVTEAARVIRDAAAFLSPTREFDEPHLEENDWPRDLDGAETLGMLGQLTEIVHGSSGCLMGISCQHGVPDAAKPDLDAIANLLTDAGRKLSVLGGTLGREAEAATPAQYAGLDFPHAPTAGPAGDSARQAAPGTPTTPPTRHSKP